MLRLYHMLHPVRSAGSLINRVKKIIIRRFGERQIRSKIRQGHCDRCWCGGELLPFKGHHSYGVCAGCGCYVNRYPPLNLAGLYSFDLYWHTMQVFHGCPTIESRAEAYKADGRLDYWFTLIKHYGPPKGKVIEIGCAPGILLAELQARGYECRGVEPDEKTAAFLRNKWGIDVRAGLFPGVELPRCDLFLALDVLEHIPDPAGFMQEVGRLLNPGGVAIIQSPIERYGLQPPSGERFGAAFNDLEHLFLFTDKAMEQLSERVNLKIINSNERWRLHHEICVFKNPN